jgi:hypothetical protein
LGFALRLAHDRGSSAFDVPDILAGMYIANLERLSKYWRSWEDFEDLVATECGLREPRWFYWIRAYESASRGKEGSYFNLLKDLSPELATIWARAGELADSRGTSASAPKPLLTPEDFLLAISRHTGSELGPKLLRSGLDVQRLEQAVKTLKPRPS